MFRLLVPLLVSCLLLLFFIFFFNDTATTEIYTLSYTTLFRSTGPSGDRPKTPRREVLDDSVLQLIAKLLTDRKSTRLNSSHSSISYAVFCLKKKTQTDFCRFEFNRR